MVASPSIRVGRWLILVPTLAATCTPAHLQTQVLAPPLRAEMSAEGQYGLRIVVEASKSPWGKAEERTPSPNFYDSIPERNQSLTLLLDFTPIDAHRYETFVPPNSKNYEFDLVYICACQACSCPPCQETTGHYLKQTEEAQVAFWTRTLDVVFQRGSIQTGSGEQAYEVVLNVPKPPGSRILARSVRLLDGDRPPEELRVPGLTLAEIREVADGNNQKTEIRSRPRQHSQQDRNLPERWPSLHPHDPHRAMPR